ncbi:MAG TPA: hypothetical protein VIJ25_14795 [Methylococcales bacterium]
MSEYQQYEFQALDRPLSSDDQTYLRSLSSRVKLTATTARFVYSFSDFRHQPETVLDRCFDLMLYMASFGVRQLMIRFPKALIKPAVFEPYCVPHLITVSTTAKSVILNINLCAEDYYIWIEDDEAWLSDLVALREELLQSDYRVLYLAWLKAGFAEDAAADPKELIEPPVPAGLKTLTPALKSFVDLFKVDPDLIAAAAQVSPMAKKSKEPVEDWIAELSETERNHYLVRVAQGETHVGVELMQHLRKRFGKTDPSPSSNAGRSLAALMEIAEENKQQRRAQEKQAAAVARRKYLEAIAPKSNALWQEVFKLVELKQAQSYDKAIALLKDLRDLAKYQENLPAFHESIRQMQSKYSNRPGLLQRLQKANL